MEPSAFITHHIRTEYCRHLRYFDFGRPNYYMYYIYIIGFHWSGYVQGIDFSDWVGYLDWVGFALWVRYVHWNGHPDDANLAEFSCGQARRRSPPLCWRREGFLRPADAGSSEPWGRWNLHC